MAEKDLRNPIEALLNSEDDKPITLFDENSKAVEFDQVAIIPDKNKVYAILKPIEKMEGIKDDEALVFVMQESDEGEDVIKVVDDEKIIEWVFEEYYKLLEAEGLK